MYQGTSTNSLTVHPASPFTITTQADLDWVAGDPISIWSTANPAHYMTGIVTSYSGTTLSFNSSACGGIGSVHADWRLNLAGAVTQLQMRRGLASEWAANDPILARAEFGVEKDDTTDTIRFKIGNGEDPWSFLPYQGGVSDFLALLDTPNDYSGQALMGVRVNASETGLEFSAAAGGGVDNFLDLLDTPDDYSGQANNIVSVKGDESGLEFIAMPAPPTIIDTFLDLLDTPNAYTGQANKVVSVKPDVSGLEFTTPAAPSTIDTFLELTDTPDAYSGQANKVVSVKGDATGLEFTTPEAPSTIDTFLELTDTPDVYTGQSLKSVRVKSDESGLEFVAAAGGGVTNFLDLTDTPNAYTGQAGKLSAVKGDESGLEFISPPAGGSGGVRGLRFDYSRAAGLVTGRLKFYYTFPYAGTITGWSADLDSGTVTLKFWKAAGARPNSGNNINTSGLAISSGHVRSSVVSDFITLAVAVGDVITAEISAKTGTPTELSAALEVTP